MILYYKAVTEVGLEASVRLVEVVEVAAYQGIVKAVTGYYYLEVIRVYYLTKTVGGY